MEIIEILQSLFDLLSAFFLFQSTGARDHDASIPTAKQQGADHSAMIPHRPTSLGLPAGHGDKRKLEEILTPEEMREKIDQLTSQLADAHSKVDRLISMNLMLQESKLSISGFASLTCV